VATNNLAVHLIMESIGIDYALEFGLIGVKNWGDWTDTDIEPVYVFRPRNTIQSTNTEYRKS